MSENTQLKSVQFCKGNLPKEVGTVDADRSSIKLDVLHNLKLCVSIFLKSKRRISDWRIAQNIHFIKIYCFYVKQRSSE